VPHLPAGARSGRASRWLAWGLGGAGLALLLLAGSLGVLLRRDAVGSGETPIGPIDLVGFVGVPVVGALIASRHPRNPYGWVWCGLGLTAGVLFVLQVLRYAGRLPAGLPGYWERFAFLGLLVLVVAVFLLFPTGRPPSAGWRWVSYAAVLLAAVGVAASLVAPSRGDPPAAGPFAQPGQAGRWWDGVVIAMIAGLFVLTLLAMLATLPRYRRAGSVERQQLKWFLFAALINAPTFVVAVLGPLGDAGWTLSNVTFGLLPAAVGIAVLRYRLYEIDRIVGRTVTYGVLTLGLLALYVVVVTALRGLLDPVTGSSDLAVAASTLAVAAAFRPARRRVQAAVDRRFDRTRYDAARTVDAYTQRLRRSVDLDDVTTGLRETVEVAVGPERVSVWLRDRPGHEGPLSAGGAQPPAGPGGPARGPAGARAGPGG
jgi:hypothetical protein